MEILAKAYLKEVKYVRMRWQNLEMLDVLSYNFLRGKLSTVIYISGNETKDVS